MTKNEAMRAIATLSSGTIANIIKCDKYSVIDDTMSKWILTIANMPESAFKQCDTWAGVLDVIKQQETINRYYEKFMKFGLGMLESIADHDEIDITGMSKEDIAMVLACNKYDEEDHYMK